MSRKTRVAYKPVGLLLGVTAGALAGAVFKQVWKQMAGDREAPDPTDLDRGWAEVLAAAALQSLVFGVVRATVERVGAIGVRRTTGRRPD